MLLFFLINLICAFRFLAFLLFSVVFLCNNFIGVFGSLVVILLSVVFLSNNLGIWGFRGLVILYPLHQISSGLILI